MKYLHPFLLINCTLKLRYDENCQTPCLGFLTADGIRSSSRIKGNNITMKDETTIL